MPLTKSRLPSLMSVLLKNSVMPRAVNAAPDDRNMIPSLRLPDVSTRGNFDGDDNEVFFLCYCFGSCQLV